MAAGEYFKAVNCSEKMSRDGPDGSGTTEGDG